MNYYEALSHGTEDFPVGVHDTICQKGFYLYPHIHREFEFLVMTKGNGVVYVDDVPYQLQAGDALFINCHQLHLGDNVNAEPAEFFAVVFAPEIFGSFSNDLIMNNYILPVMNKSLALPIKYSSAMPWQNNIIELLHRLHKHYLDSCTGSELIIKALLMEIWQLCFINSNILSETVSDPTIENIKKAAIYIRQHYASPLSLENISAHVNMSRSYFCRCFSDIMHMTPFEYLLQTRIDNSCRLLKSTSLSIGEIAGQCGFNSFSYFSKTFKRFMGITPREYISKL